MGDLNAHFLGSFVTRAFWTDGSRSASTYICDFASPTTTSQRSTVDLVRMFATKLPGNHTGVDRRLRTEPEAPQGSVRRSTVTFGQLPSGDLADRHALAFDNWNVRPDRRPRAAHASGGSSPGYRYRQRRLGIHDNGREALFSSEPPRDCIGTTRSTAILSSVCFMCVLRAF